MARVERPVARLIKVTGAQAGDHHWRTIKRMAGTFAAGFIKEQSNIAFGTVSSFCVNHPKACRV